MLEWKYNKKSRGSTLLLSIKRLQRFYCLKIVKDKISKKPLCIERIERQLIEMGLHPSSMASVKSL